MSRLPDMRPRLLLHVGLPKTATTSLQQNVLMPWHDARRINFLGRHWEDGTSITRSPGYSNGLRGGGSTPASSTPCDRPPRRCSTRRG